MFTGSFYLTEPIGQGGFDLIQGHCKVGEGYRSIAYIHSLGADSDIQAALGQ